MPYLRPTSEPGDGLNQYERLSDDIASAAYWYQTLPAQAFPALPDRDYLELI